MGVPIIVAVEDRLSGVVAHRLLEESRVEYDLLNCLCRGGFGYLKKRINSFNSAAQHQRFFVLTDLDNPRICPQALIESWLSSPKNPQLIFRVAVVEVETWLLADRETFADFVGVSRSLIPPDVESIDDPKGFLVGLARRSRFRVVRQDLVPTSGSTSKQGPNYNDRLSDYVRSHWRPSIASRHAGSLSRCVAALDERL